MNARNFSRQRFWRDLTRTRHMTAVSAVILATIFMPLLGLPNLDEIRVFQGAVEQFSDARAHAQVPPRDDETARARMSQSLAAESDDDRGAMGFVDRVLTVVRPARQTEEATDVADITPLPPVEEPSYAVADEPLAEDEVDLPELIEEPVTIEPEEEYYEEDEPIVEEEDEF